MNRPFPSVTVTLPVLALLLAFTVPSSNAAPTAVPWAPELVHSPQAWSSHMNDAIVGGQDGGLRVEVAPGKTWAIAAVPDVLLPSYVGEIRAQVGSVGGGGRWLVRLHGDLRGRGVPGDYGPFQGEITTGFHSLEIDPRLLRLQKQPPVEVQLGVEGPPGSFAVFNSLEFLPGSAAGRQAKVIPGQRNIEAVDLMPNIPQPFRMIDWRARAIDYDRFVFNPNLRGQYLPLTWLDDSRVNFEEPTFGLCSYVGDHRQGTSHEEGINCMGAVLGATLVGIDKSRQDHDFVRMCRAYYNTKNGANLVLNEVRAEAGGSFWYDLWPHIVFYALADRYPSETWMKEIVHATAQRWCDVSRAMGLGENSVPNFDHTAFNFKTMQPVDNGRWREPDAAAGTAWLEYAAWNQFHDPQFLQASEGALRFLQQRRDNPYYEVLLPWGALTAARMNAELGRDYDVDKLVNWSFGISDCRGGWGVTVGTWGGYDCAGLVGSVDNRGGYAFTMNTFAQAGALVPLARYDTRYARAIGKWMLNLANAARLFYPDGLPADHQSPPAWNGDPGGVTAFEGLRREWEDKSPCATGDPVAMHWGPETDRGLYGSSYVGILGAIVGRTRDDKILALDCLATDFYRAPAYPTRLIYNPYPTKKQVTIDVGPAHFDLYDAVSHRFLARNASGRARFSLDADTAAVVVLTPPHGALALQGRHTQINGVVVDYGG